MRANRGVGCAGGARTAGAVRGQEALAVERKLQSQAWVEPAPSPQGHAPVRPEGEQARRDQGAMLPLVHTPGAHSASP